MPRRGDRLARAGLEHIDQDDERSVGRTPGGRLTPPEGGGAAPLGWPLAGGAYGDGVWVVTPGRDL
jgi:hypothetical protein